MPGIRDVAPKLPVVEKEKLDEPFYIFSAPSQFTGRYGTSWRLPCVGANTGEQFLMLFAANDVRDHDFGSLVTYFQSNADRIGPLTLARTALKDGNSTWELVDADEPETTAKK